MLRENISAKTIEVANGYPRAKSSKSVAKCIKKLVKHS